MIEFARSVIAASKRFPGRYPTAAGTPRSWLLRSLCIVVLLLPSVHTLAQFEGGNGSADTPYQIATPAGLNAIRNNLSANYILTADIDLTAATREGGAYWHGGLGWEPIGYYSSDGEPIAFRGSLDGNGFKIRGLHIDRPGSDYIGLFGIATGSGTGPVKLAGLALEEVSVKGGSSVGGLVGEMGSNVRIEHSYVAGSVTATGNKVGGLAGDYDGAIESSYATAAVSGSSRVGGLVGATNGIITRSYATGNVSGIGNVGGLAGELGGALDDSIADSYAMGDVTGNTSVGGLVGNASSGTVSNSYAIGSVNDGAAGTGIGGLVGSLSNPASVNNSYWNTETTGQSSSAGGEGVTGLTSAEMRQQTSFAEFDFDDTWQIQESVTFPVLQGLLQSPAPGVAAPVISSPSDLAAGVSRQPVLQWTAASDESAAITASYDLQVSANEGFSSFIVNETDRNGTEYTITADLALGATIYWRVRSVNAAGESAWTQSSFTTTFFLGGDGLSKETAWQIATPAGLNAIRNDLAAHYILVDNIDLTEATREGGDYWHGGLGWEPIGVYYSAFSPPFTGSLNGNDRKITGLFINRTENGEAPNSVGLVGVISGSATLTGLALEAVNITGGQNVGGLVSRATGINNRIENSYVTGSVTGTGAFAGGLVGHLENGDIGNSYTSVAVSGLDSVGGLAGRVGSGDITNSYASGNVSGGGVDIGGLVGILSRGTIARSYATGNVSGDGSVGGLVGLASQSPTSIANSYATGDVVGNSRVGGLVGLAAAGTVNNSYAIGSVSVSDGGAGTEIGGLVGGPSSGGATITNSYWNTETTGQGSSAGSDDSFGLTSAQMRLQCSFGDLECADTWDFTNTWQIQPGLSFPVLKNLVQSPAPGFDAPDVPVISSPANLATRVVRQPVLDWEAASAAAADMTDTYDLQVSANAAFSSFIVNQTGITDTQYAINTDLALDATIYWRVRSVNGAGESDWTPTSSFTTTFFTGGDGLSKETAWQIATPAGLNEIRNNPSAHFILSADIDLTEATR
ncbi:MAG: GLUG motif-containing protein, partial [Pseudohongiella sp.]|uniref:beta strand repeat-containing protein n=1 Tax=Pseudohongiella sp. TaxID=1979412 RepID=UPI0034A01A0D